MSSVWVCSAYGGVVPKGTPQQCDRLRGKKCYRHGTIENDCDAVEYAPVVRGKWELYQPNACFLAKYRCSVCKEEHRNPSEKYCPSCGAKMEEQ